MYERNQGAVFSKPKNILTRANKIGYSKDPEKRRAGLRSSNPGRLILIGSIQGGLEHERFYHDKFADHRLHGEWFDGVILPAVTEIIAKNPPDGPPAPVERHRRR